MSDDDAYPDAHRFRLLAHEGREGINRVMRKIELRVHLPSFRAVTPMRGKSASTQRVRASPLASPTGFEPVLPP